MGVRRILPIIVRRAPGNSTQARVQLAHGIRPAAIGRGSVRPLKRDIGKCEGDHRTPDRSGEDKSHVVVEADDNVTLGEIEGAQLSAASHLPPSAPLFGGGYNKQIPVATNALLQGTFFSVF